MGEASDFNSSQHSYYYRGGYRILWQGWEGIHLPPAREYECFFCSPTIDYAWMQRSSQRFCSSGCQTCRTGSDAHELVWVRQCTSVFSSCIYQQSGDQTDGCTIIHVGSQRHNHYPNCIWSWSLLLWTQVHLHSTLGYPSPHYLSTKFSALQ